MAFPPHIRPSGLTLSTVVLALAAAACAPGHSSDDPADSRAGADDSLGEAQQGLLQNYNVATYGANPADFNDDTAAIQNAILAAVNAGGGTVYFPRGEYDISDTLVIPRSTTKPLIFLGEGRTLSRITTELQNLASNKPVIAFGGTESAKEIEFRDLMIGRVNDGPVFYHDQPLPGTQIWRAVFQRVAFHGVNDPDGVDPGTPSSDLVYIKGGLYLLMDDVTFNGGNTALTLEDTYYSELRHVHTDQDLQVNHGIALIGGGEHSIYHARIQAAEGGSAVRIEGGQYGIRDIQIDGLTGGGKKTQSFIKLAGSAAAPVTNVILKNIQIPPPWGPDKGYAGAAYGIDINDWVHNVQLLNGTISSWSKNLANGGRLLRIAAGARNIDIHGLDYVDPIANNGLADYIAVAPGASRVHVELTDGNFERWVRDEGMIGAWSASGATAYVGADATVSAGSNPGPHIATLLQRKGGAAVATPPQAGQRVVLLGSAASPVLESGTGNLRLSSPVLTLGPDTVLQLVFDGANWQEISRSVN